MEAYVCKVSDEIHYTEHEILQKKNHSPWINFAPEEFFGGDQFSDDEYTSKNSKSVDLDCIMKAFFDERNYWMVMANSWVELL